MQDPDRTPEPFTFEQVLDAERRARQRLAAAHAATRVLASAAVIEEAVTEILAEVCRTLGFQWAAFWQPADAGDVLRCTAVYEDPSGATAPFSALVRGMTFRSGAGLPGRVWADRAPHWIAELREDPNFPRAPLAAEVGLRGGFAFPVVSDDEIVGVMEFFAASRLPPNPELLESLSAVGAQIGLFVSRRRAERLLRASEERFRAFAESASDAAFSIDEHSIIIYANPAVERIFGYRPDEIVGRPLTLLIPERLRDAHRAGVERHLRTGKRNIPWEGVELPALHRSGQEVPVEISFGSYTMEGHRYFTGMVRDITDRLRQKELLENTAAELEAAVEDLRARTEESEAARIEAEEADRAKSDFLAIISHELRTPLNAIIGYTDLLLSGIPEPLPDPARGHVDRVRGASQHLLELIEEILSFSNIEAGGERVRVESVDLPELIRDVADIAEPLAARKGLVLRVSAPDDARVETDPAKVRQILLNLLSNAVKFTDEGEIELSGEVANGGVLLRVRDTGIGIRSEHLPRVFDAFWQAETAATRRQGGTGLGLAVSRKLAQLLGGDIAVESAPGKGSTFTVLLPRTRS